MFQEYIKPVLVLTIICLVLSGALALVYNATAPVIAEDAAERAGATMREIIPGANEFDEIDIAAIADIPSGILEAYSTSNDAGYIIIASAKGYGGEIRVLCAIDNDGKIIKAITLAHTETKGIGTILEEDSFLSQFISTDSRLEGIDTVTGATVSTSAFIRAVRDAFTAFEIIAGY